MRKRRARVLTAGILALALMPGGCGDVEDRAADAAPTMAPDYAAVTLEQDPVTLQALRGEVVLLNVWATWCVPCRQEIPELQALHEEHRERGLRVVGVTVDSRRALDDVEDFIHRFGMTYDVWWDPDQVVMSRFEAMGVPLTVLIDREGHMVWRHLGAFERGDPDLLAAIRTAL